MTTETSKATNETEIRGLIEAWAAAIRAKDANGVVSHTSPESVRFAYQPSESFAFFAKDLIGNAKLVIRAVLELNESEIFADSTKVTKSRAADLSGLVRFIISSNFVGLP